MNVNVKNARANFSQLLDAVAAGQEVTIQRHGAVVARLVPPKKAKPNRLPSLQTHRDSMTVRGKSLSQEVILARDEERY